MDITKTNPFERNKRMKEIATELASLLDLEARDIIAGIEYDSATSSCSCCPRNGCDDYSYTCCKDTGEWDEQYQDQLAYAGQCSELEKSLKTWLESKASEVK